MNKTLTTKALLLALPLAAALTACPSAGSNPGGGNGLSVTGTVALASAGSIGDLYVLACPGGDCSAADTKVVTLSKAGHSVNFTVGGLTKQQYGIVAWSDKNGNQDVDAGDLLGFFTTDGQTLAPVTPPASNLSISISQQ